MFVPCGDLKNLPVHSSNVFIIPILRDCLPNYFSSPELKAPGELMVWEASVVRRPPTHSDDFFTETTGPNVTKFYT